MILAYKAFAPGLIATKGKGRYQYHKSRNVTDKASCAATGFHCAENPLDCLKYYDWNGENEFWAVAAGGDIDEDCTDSRISCTELTLIRRLAADEFLLLYANYVFEHPTREHMDINTGIFHVVHGLNKAASGKAGDWLCFIETEGKELWCIVRQVDGKQIKAGVAYTAYELEAIDE